MTKNYYTVNGVIMGESSGGVTTKYLRDALGSVVATFDNNGTVQNTYRYKPSGELLAKTGTAPDPDFRFVGTTGARQTGRRYSELYFRRRHLDVQGGRWSTVNSLWPRRPQYTYVAANPTSSTPCIGPESRTGSAPCDPGSGRWPDCTDTRGLLDCYNRKIDPDRCPGGKWQACDPPGVFKYRCSSKDCDAIKKQIIANDRRMTTGDDLDTEPGKGWGAATGCCAKTGGQGSFTVCCSTGPLGTTPTAPPCVAYCLLAAHEGFGHGTQCARHDQMGPGSPGSEVEALMCERDCLMQAFAAMCKGMDPPPPSPPWKNGFAGVKCSGGDRQWF